jgi:hypothetical protein
MTARQIVRAGIALSLRSRASITGLLFVAIIGSAAVGDRPRAVPRLVPAVRLLGYPADAKACAWHAMSDWTTPTG